MSCVLECNLEFQRILLCLGFQSLALGFRVLPWVSSLALSFRVQETVWIQCIVSSAFWDRAGPDKFAFCSLWPDRHWLLQHRLH